MPILPLSPGPWLGLWLKTTRDLEHFPSRQTTPFQRLVYLNQTQYECFYPKSRSAERVIAGVIFKKTCDKRKFLQWFATHLLPAAITESA